MIFGHTMIERQFLVYILTIKNQQLKNQILQQGLLCSSYQLCHYLDDLRLNISVPQTSSLLSEQRVKCQLLSRVRLYATPWTHGPIDLRILPGSSVHEIFQKGILEWVGLFPSPGNLPNPGIEPGSPALQADSLPSESPGMPHNST